MNDYERNLQRFSDMDDVEVSEDDPDVRGWDVVTRDGRDIGEVKDLLVDPSSMKVRCLEVELEGSHFKWDDNRRVAIPIESVQLDEDHDDVVVNGLALDEIGRLEEYRPSGATFQNEARSRDSYAGESLSDNVRHELRGASGTGRGVEHGADRLTRSEEELRVGKREVAAGEVRVRKEVETERVNQPVERARERVRIRAPASHRGDARQRGAHRA